MKKRGRPRGSENNPIDFGESQESCASLMNHLDALQVEEDEIQPERYSPPAATTVRRLRSGSLLSPPVVTVAVGARSKLRWLFVQILLRMLFVSLRKARLLFCFRNLL